MDKPEWAFWLTQYLPFLVFRYFLKCSSWNVFTYWVCVERETHWEFIYSAFVSFLCSGPSLAVPEASTPTSHYFSPALQLPPSIRPLGFLYKTEFPAVGPRKKKMKSLLTLPTQTNSGNFPALRLRGMTQAKKWQKKRSSFPHQQEAGCCLPLPKGTVLLSLELRS